MKTLFDKTTVKRLAQTVRQTSPDDWKASRMRRKHQWLSREGLSAKFWNLVTYPFLALFICIPFMMEKPQKLPLPTACGMMTLNFLILGVLCAGLFFHYKAPHLHPLINTPADGRQVFLFVLNDLRKQMKRKLASLLGYGLCAFLFMSLVVTNTLTWENILRAIGGGPLIIGPSLALGCALQMLPRFMNRLRQLLMGIGVFILCWQITTLMTSEILSFGILGKEMIFLPQTKICLWILGGPLPLGEMLLCASMMLLAIFLITNPLRDRGESFTDTDVEEPLEIRAELFAQLAVKKWQQELREQEFRYESEYDDEEALNDSDDESQPSAEELPLLGHEAAPIEHNHPVSDEFRHAISNRCRALLDAKAADCPLEDYLSPPVSDPSKMPLARKVTLIGGTLFPLLLEPWARLPEEYGKWFLIAALSLVAFPVAITAQNPPHNLHMTSRQWVHLPLDPARYARRLFAYQRRLFVLRCVLVLRTIGAILLGGIAWIYTRSALGLTEVEPVTLSRIFGGEISLISISCLLLLAVVSLRYVEAMSFFGSLFHLIQWRGHWRKLSSFYAFMTVISASGLLGALFLILAKGQGYFQWQNILLCLLLSEAAYHFNLWLAIQAARWGRGDWVGHRGHE